MRRGPAHCWPTCHWGRCLITTASALPPDAQPERVVRISSRYGVVMSFEPLAAVLQFDQVLKGLRGAATDARSMG